eukprot:scaffold34484_cov39-Cyclotella_meneghiniana.AAC.1
MTFRDRERDSPNSPKIFPRCPIPLLIAFSYNLGKILEGRLPSEIFARISCVHLGEHSLRPFQDISIVPAYVDRNATKFTTIPKSTAIRTVPAYVGSIITKSTTIPQLYPK